MAEFSFNPDGEDDHDPMRQPHAPFDPQTPEILNVVITPKPGRILHGHSEYRDQVKIRVDVERDVGCSFKELALGEPPSMQHLENNPPNPPALFLSGAASCASCMMRQAADNEQRCNPPTFPLIPSKVGVLLSFDDSNTRYSRVATFKIPFRCRKPKGRMSRCGAESLIVSFKLKDSFGRVATFQMETPLRIRKHEKPQSKYAPVQPQYAPFQPSLLALAQSNSAFTIDTTVLPPPPPPPHIVDINPQYMDRIPQVNESGLEYRIHPGAMASSNAIEFGQAGMVATSYLSEEGDQVQFLECPAPIPPAPFIPWPYAHYPQIPIGTGEVDVITPYPCPAMIWSPPGFQSGTPGSDC